MLKEQSLEQLDQLLKEYLDLHYPINIPTPPWYAENDLGRMTFEANQRSSRIVAEKFFRTALTFLRSRGL